VALQKVGIKAIILEKGTEIGGTWFWNRYPGCKCDIPILEYMIDDLDFNKTWKGWEKKYPSMKFIFKQIISSHNILYL
jgi:cyclohexanone monooxygenase